MIIDSQKINALMEKFYNYHQVHSDDTLDVDDTCSIFNKPGDDFDQIHIGENGEFSRCVMLKRNTIRESIIDCLNVWKTTRSMHFFFINNLVLPMPTDSIIILITGNLSDEFLNQLINGIWVEFSQSYYGVAANQSFGSQCALMRIRFKKNTLSNEQIYDQIPELLLQHSKLELLQMINHELALPQDDFGFNFKDATISKLALAKILLGIQRLLNNDDISKDDLMRFETHTESQMSRKKP